MRTLWVFLRLTDKTKTSVFEDKIDLVARYLCIKDLMVILFSSCRWELVALVFLASFRLLSNGFGFDGW